ncbi:MULTISPECIES: hypothetical protein [Streptomyces]|uniref:hypothetical protein n=1 Tax=Streptomyces TaxID=1883 RepID=UPI0029ADAE19|nr:hypothetical protein [Streptomyces sp. WI03-4A]MDX2591301.1 hypothetical protein [Streptomyces sp. WI03-4A]
MKKIIVLGVLTLGALSVAAPAQADGISNSDAIIHELAPSGAGLPLLFGPLDAIGHGALGGMVPMG